jgi:hypothetical protein
MRALLLSVVAAVSLVAVVSAGGRSPATVTQAASWRGFVGDPRPQVSMGQRMIVVLKAPSVAERLAHARYATEVQERTWNSQALAAQEEVLAALAVSGIGVQPDFRFSRVLNGFSASLDPRAVSFLQQDADVAGIYPVRATFPASTSQRLIARAGFARTATLLPGLTGRGVSVALLDTGVDLTHPWLREHVARGIDLVDAGDDASARPDPQDPSQLERHGTEMAGIVLHGVAPRATVFPIRVAGWGATTTGTDAIYGRSDQLIAGLDRAVDPNGDGDEHDAARIALVGVAEPYAAFVDDPEAQAVQGALELNTLVVAPAGNEGAAGPAFGSIAGPAAAPDAVAVAATDARPQLEVARVVLRTGLDVLYDKVQPLLGPEPPAHALTLTVGVPRAGAQSPTEFFDGSGNSLVAGKAAMIPLGGDPAAAAAAAEAAGARAVLLYGDAVPAGALRVGENLDLPVAWVPEAAADALLAARRAGLDVGVAIGRGRQAANGGLGYVAGFSSRGLAFDGRVKPDVSAPGVGLATAEPGTAPDGTALYGTVNGTSGAAATVAGAAALLVEMRPSLTAVELRSLLVGYAQHGGAPATQTGAGTFRVGASAVGEVAADDATLGFGVWQGAHWHATRTLVVRNVTTRRLGVSVSAVTTSGESEALQFAVSPQRLVLREGQAKRVRITVHAPVAPASAVVDGVIQVTPDGGQSLRVPWALAFRAPHASLLPQVTIDRASFAPSDTNPAILTVRAGALATTGGLQVEPVSRLDVLLYTASGRFVGVMARLRDLLPGTYSFGITGRGPSSAVLPPGSYELRLAAWPTLPLQAQPSRATLRFRVQ